MTSVVEVIDHYQRSINKSLNDETRVSIQMVIALIIQKKIDKKRKFIEKNMGRFPFFLSQNRLIKLK